MKILLAVPFLCFILRASSIDMDNIKYQIEELFKDEDPDTLAIVKSKFVEHFVDIPKVLDSLAEEDLIAVLEDFNVERLNEMAEKIFGKNSQVMSRLQHTSEAVKQQIVSLINHLLGKDIDTRRKRANEDSDIFSDILDNQKSALDKKKDRRTDDKDDLLNSGRDLIQPNKDDVAPLVKIKENPVDGLLEKKDKDSPLVNVKENPIKSFLKKKDDDKKDDSPFVNIKDTVKGFLEKKEDDQDDDSSLLDIKDSPLQGFLDSNKDDKEKPNFSDSWREWSRDFLSAKKEKFRRLHDNSKQSRNGVFVAYRDFGRVVMDLFEKIAENFRKYS